MLFTSQSTKAYKYFSYATHGQINISEKEAEDRLQTILERSMNRALKIIGDQTVAIPLTSGYDSRFLTVWLAQNHPGKIITFTCGTPDSPEFENARKVADKLQLKWIPVYHDDQNIQKTFNHNPRFGEYIDFTFSASSMSFFQDFPPLASLDLPKNTIIAGGHSGDFLAGSHLWPLQNKMTKPQLMHYAFQRMFPYFEGINPEKQALMQSLKNAYAQTAGQLAYSRIEAIDFDERQSKFIVNSCRSYDFFAGKTVLPLLDNEVIDFFRTLPFHLKFMKKAYNKVLKTRYFEPLNVSFQKEYQPRYTNIFKKIVKQTLPSPIRRLHTSNKPVEDFCNYAEIARQISPKSFSIKENYDCPNQLIINWYIQYLNQQLQK